MPYIRKVVAIMVVVLGSLHLNSLFVHAAPGDYQTCYKGETCIVGEYFFDDNSAPITTGATCTLNSYDPSGAIQFNNTSLTPTSDGWYAHSFATDSFNTGLYRSNLCCDYQSDRLCIDKSFQIQDTIEDSVWEAKTENHTSSGSFGDSLANISTDIWDHSDRSLNNFSELITAIWAEDTSSSDPSTLTQILNQISQNRQVLEQLLNQPFITIPQDSYDPSTLQSHLFLAQEYLPQIYADTQNVQNRLDLLILNWDTMSASAITAELTSMLDLLGNDPSSPDYHNDVISQLNWFNTAWSNTTTNDTYAHTQEALTFLNQALGHVDVGNKTPQALAWLTSAQTSLQAAEGLIGNISSPPNDDTLYGLVAQLEADITALSRADEQLDNLIHNWSHYNTQEAERQLNRIRDNVLQVNSIPQPDQILTNHSDNILGAGSDSQSNQTNSDGLVENLLNQATNLKALIDLNQRYLANTNQAPIQTVWMESRSPRLAFRSAIFNPSSSTNHNYNLYYFLPKELSTQDIVSHQGELSFDYNSDQELVSVTGGYNLSPREVELQEVVTDDKWLIHNLDLETIRQQSTELLASLEDTSFYAQGLQLKNNIDTSLNSIQNNLAQATIAEEHIMAYRQSRLELESVNENMAHLNDLVSQAANANSIFGFVGGIQAVSVWGIIIIVIAGFVFLTIYMRKLMSQPATIPTQTGLGPNTSQQSVAINRPLDTITPSIPFIYHNNQPKTATKKAGRVKDSDSRMFHVLFMVLAATAFSGIVFGSINSALNNSSSDSSSTEGVANQAQPIPNRPGDETLTSQPLVLGTEDNTLPLSQGELEGVQQFWAYSPDNNTGVTVYQHPSEEAEVVTNLINPTPITIQDFFGTWTQVTFTKNGSNLEGWIQKDFITSTDPEQ